MLKVLDRLEEILIASLIAGATLLIFVAVTHRYALDLSAKYHFDALMRRQEQTGAPRDLARDQIDIAQNLERAKRDIARIADRRRDHIEDARSSARTHDGELTTKAQRHEENGHRGDPFVSPALCD